MATGGGDGDSTVIGEAAATTATGAAARGAVGGLSDGKSVKGTGQASDADALDMFPQLMVQMATVGEESGNLDLMFERVAEYYEEELDNAIGSITSLIEPAMMMVVGGLIVGVFVMGILLPIMGISAGVQKQM
ncbi:MAG: type II secretion system F family protein [Candidatus Xenobia bacterium]